MQKVQIVCIGKLKETYWRQACAEYEKRLRPFVDFQIRELPECRLPDAPSQAQIDAALEEEAVRILEACRGGEVIPLCIEGKALDSPMLAAHLQQAANESAGRISFVIGSSFGLASSVKQAGRLRLSMSPMTFPHQLARVMLCEQIYRAYQILHHGKYHK
ncbi:MULTISPECIES: 23S rRNA (pseudouridine(1915)-N(3))-methyltransferase RlmH [Caproicibacterium]|uniref:Ribosomal RNA large subunit methyltransferase H n=1 Tax=Caproicibacterium argilliputei TaxID=3030016 RepID=A0AA97D9Z4_9FIRM|nr:23S rRNA (pseudouridine(1915)-N(3))-methyltransferase RlmH [Caproicibacterium argilliputei]WOC33335.1 23S rRNA (pseudouridine(1915)-N(3))-methyltransferase RlmH [Caproicibacterium argilliputei]